LAYLGRPRHTAEGTANHVEILANLIYLIKHDREDPNKVLHYAEMASESLRYMRQMVETEQG
jgi:hypothetical protein